MHTHLILASTLVTIAIAVTLGYAGLCAVRPFKPCPRCRATGIKRLILGRSRVCRRCNGDRRVLRPILKGRNHLRRAAHELAKGRK